MKKQEEYDLAMRVGQLIFEEIKHWDYYSKNSVGIKLQTSADYIAVFIAKSNRTISETIEISYFRHTKGVIFETKTWLTKAYQRHLMGEEEFNTISNSLNELYLKIKALQPTTD